MLHHEGHALGVRSAVQTCLKSASSQEALCETGNSNGTDSSPHHARPTLQAQPADLQSTSPDGRHLRHAPRVKSTISICTRTQSGRHQPNGVAKSERRADVKPLHVILFQKRDGPRQSQRFPKSNLSSALNGPDMPEAAIKKKGSVRN